MNLRKILVVDESATIQKVIKLALSSEGYDILAVSQADEVVKAIEHEKPQAVLINVQVSGVNAFELKKRVDAKTGLAPIIFVLMASAFEKIDEKQFRDSGYKAKLIKPFDPGNLRRVLQEVLGGPPAPPAKDLDTEFTESEEDLTPIQDLQPSVDLDLPSMDSDLASSDIQLENDIRGLTESTIKISGLDDYEWSLDDKRKLKADSGPKSMPTPPPPAPSKFFDDGGSTFMRSSTKAPEHAAPPPTQLPTLSRGELEALIKKDLHEQIAAKLEKAVKEMVPQIAENLIRKEIEKLISD